MVTNDPRSDTPAGTFLFRPDGPTTTPAPATVHPRPADPAPWERAAAARHASDSFCIEITNPHTALELAELLDDIDHDPETWDPERLAADLRHAANRTWPAHFTPDGGR